jgi:hypothetical protein
MASSRKAATPSPHDARQHHYIRLFETMDSMSMQMLRRIYQLSKHTHGGGQHVIEALIGAMRSPLIFRLVRENIVLRSALAVARTQGDTARAHHIEGLLEDFHIALDAYMQDLSLAEAATRRSQTPRGDAMACTRLPDSALGMIRQDWEDLFRLKARLKPTLAKVERLRSVS